MFWSRPLAGSDGAISRNASCGRVGLDVHHPRPESGGVGDGDAVVDLFLARGRDQHLDLVGIVRRRTEDLEIEVDLVERERDVLVGLGLDLELELLLASGPRAR